MFFLYKHAQNHPQENTHIWSTQEQILFGTILLAHGISHGKYKYIYMTGYSKTSKIICTQNAQWAQAWNRDFQYTKEAWKKFLREEEIYDPQRKLYVSVKSTPQEGWIMGMISFLTPFCLNYQLIIIWLIYLLSEISWVILAP